MKNRFFYSLSLFTILAATCLMGYLYYLAFWPFNVVDIKNASRVFPNKVKIGDRFFVTTDYCKHMDISAEVHTTFVDGVVISLPVQYSNVPVGCHTISRSFVVPPEILPGKYTLNRDFVFKINLLQTQVVHSTTEQFEVIQ